MIGRDQTNKQKGPGEGGQTKIGDVVDYKSQIAQLLQIYGISNTSVISPTTWETSYTVRGGKVFNGTRPVAKAKYLIIKDNEVSTWRRLSTDEVWIWNAGGI